MAAAALFCVSSSLTSQGVRAFSTTANTGSLSAFVRSSSSKNKARASYPVVSKTSIAFAADNTKIGASALSKNSFWRTTTTSLRMASTVADEETSAVAKASGDYDIENKEKGLGNYVPTEFESEIYQWWEAAGCFQPDAKQTKEESDANGRKPYVLPMPPPNVTGRLHMGHAIFVALQDILARFHRMRGRPVLWLPGALHVINSLKKKKCGLHSTTFFGFGIFVLFIVCRDIDNNNGGAEHNTTQIDTNF